MNSSTNLNEPLLRFLFTLCVRFPRGSSMFAFAVLYFTGSGDFNMNMRCFAKSKGLKLNDKGLFKVDAFSGEEVPNSGYRWDRSRCLPQQQQQLPPSVAAGVVAVHDRQHQEQMQLFSVCRPQR